MPISNVTAKSFYSDQPPPRIIGTECEYNVQTGVDKNGKEFRTKDYISREAIFEAGFAAVGQYLSNGARIYEEIGRHLEYSSPECLGPTQAAAADLAGVIAVKKIVKASGLPHKGIYRITGSFLPGKEGTTNGYHENYLIPRSVMDTTIVDRLLPSFLASRTWAMSGSLRRSFVLSQKVWGLGDNKPVTRVLERLTSAGNKPMCIMRPQSSDKDVIGTNNDWARAEVRFADAGLSPTNRFLGLAATSLALRLFEYSKKVGGVSQLDQLQLKNPVQAAKVFAGDLSFKKVVETDQGKKYSALDIQEAFAEFALELSNRVALPDDEVQAVHVLLDLYQRLRQSDFASGDYYGLDRLLDVAAKHQYLLTRHKPNELSSRNSEASQRNLLWDKIEPDGGGMLWWRRFPSLVVTNDAIGYFIDNAPPTRATRRAKYIKEDSRLKNVNWTSATLANVGDVQLRDPYL